MIKDIYTIELSHEIHHYESIACDPNNKSGDKKEKVLNGQDDNSYDEADEIKSSKENKQQVKQPDTNKDFEYSNNGEFENDSFITNTNPNEEYL
jgi:hypothetical protein